MSGLKALFGVLSLFRGPSREETQAAQREYLAKGLAEAKARAYMLERRGLLPRGYFHLLPRDEANRLEEYDGHMLSTDPEYKKEYLERLETERQRLQAAAKGDWGRHRELGIVMFLSQDERQKCLERYQQWQAATSSSGHSEVQRNESA